MKIYLKKYRELAGVTQQQLSDATAIPLKTIQDWEQTGRSPRDMQRLVPIADALSCTTDDLLGRTMHPIPPGAIRAVASQAYVPLLGSIAAGDPLDMIEWDGEVCEITAGMKERYPNGFCLIAHGDSMNKLFPDGAYLLVDPSVEIASGNIAAVNVNGDDATVKRVFFAGDNIVLHPESYSPEHRDRVIDTRDPDAPPVRSIGKVVYWYVDMERV